MTTWPVPPTSRRTSQARLVAENVLRTIEQSGYGTERSFR